MVVRQVTPAATPSPLSGREEWSYLGATLLIILGLFIDIWSHGHVNRLGESLLTPWHWGIYAGYILSALILFRIVERHRVPGAGWRGALPRGYEYAVIVTFLFPIAAGLDLVWHGLFGVEAGVEGLLSPTHILLITSACLMIGAAFRSWSLTDPGRLSTDRWATWRGVVSLAGVVASFEVVLRYSSPLNSLFGAPGSEQIVTFGVTGFLLHSAVYSGAIAAILQKRVALPPGALTVMFLGQGVGVGILSSTIATGVATALAAGITADGLLLVFRRRNASDSWLVLIPPAAIAAMWTAYFVVVYVRHGIAWSIHVWSGTIAVSTVLAALISLLALRRLDATAGADTPEASGTPRSRR